MSSLLIFWCFFQMIVFTMADFQCNPNGTVVKKYHSRVKRSLTFPQGTSFVLTLTGLKAIQVKEPPNWNLDFEFDMTWPIPQTSDIKKLKITKKEKMYYHLRRHKRDLYNSLEMALDRLGFPGKDCILRTICEARTFLHPPGVSFIDDLLRVILSHGEYSAEKLDMYEVAYKTETNCHWQYRCPISLLQFLLNNHYLS